MAIAQLVIGEGVTDPVYITLEDINTTTRNGTAAPLTGVSLVDFRIRSEDKTATFNYDTTNDPGNLAISDEANGIVKFTPAGNEFDYAKKWYNAFFMVTDASGAEIRFPSEGYFQIEVVEYW